MLNTCMKFYEHILDGFKVIEWKQLLTKFEGTELRSINKRVMVLALMSVNISMMFHENTLKGFKVIEHTLFVTELLITNFKGT